MATTFQTNFSLTIARPMPNDELDAGLHPSSPWTKTSQETENISMLPPVDGGRDAWSFLAAALVIDIMVWGFPWSYGIFQDYYSIVPPFAGSSGLSAVGSSSIGILYMTEPLVFGPLIRFPQYKRAAIVAGLCLMCLALGLSSLCNTVPQLILTQGVLYGIGGAITYCPVIQCLDEWFVRRKGLAFGITWTGTGIGGVVIPLLLQNFLHTYGHRNVLRVWALVLFIVSLPLIWFLKPRDPKPAAKRTQLTFIFLKDRSFWILQIGNICQAIGFFAPFIYLPTYMSKQLGLDSTLSALPIVLINIATMFGSIVMGTIVDRFHVTTAIGISTIGAVLSVFFLWGFSTSLAPLLTFSTMYGLFAGTFTNNWPGIMRTVQEKTGHMEGPMILAFLSLGRGMGNVIAGPVSEALMRSGSVGGLGLYGTRYGSLVLFTGISAAFGGVGVLAKWLG